MKILMVALLLLVTYGCSHVAGHSFTARTNYMSSRGYAHWQAFLQSGRW